MQGIGKIIDFPVEENLSDEELEDFEPIFTDLIRKICAFSDKHNFDRDSMLAYFSDVLKAVIEIATIENFEV